MQGNRETKRVKKEKQCKLVRNTVGKERVRMWEKKKRLHV